MSFKMHISSVRCFDKNLVIPIRPITIITGENSSGKSTLLNCIYQGYRLISSTALIIPQSSYFYDFENVATYKGGRNGKAKFFEIGFEKTENKHTYLKKLRVINNMGGSEITSANYQIAEKKLEYSFVDDRTIKLKLEDERNSKEYGLNKSFVNNNPLLLRKSPEYIFYANLELRNRFMTKNKTNPDMNNYVSMLMARHIWDEKFEMIAPIRTLPRKTYDNALEPYTEEGDHIPYQFKSFYDKSHGRAVNPHLHEKWVALEKFGRESGLFSEISPRKLGRRRKDPFQIEVSVSGPAVNMTEVGYGVSQSFPILINSIFNIDRNTHLVLQQPEVHLHPRAQAALGSLFASIVGKKSGNFIIETHSDFIVDRIKHCIAKNIISCNDVVIIHLNKKHGATMASVIDLDKNGEVIDPPDCYRDFFFREQLDML